jgi:hypothetical protein
VYRARVTSEALPPDLAALVRFARLMDAAVRVPGTSKRVGLDPLIGLLPVVGDFAGAGLSLWVLYSALRHRVPPGKLLRIAWNIFADTAFGAIPVIGDVFDMFWDSNVWNAEIVLTHRDASRPPRRSGAIAGVFALASCAILIAALLAIFALGALLWYALVRAFA